MSTVGVPVNTGGLAGVRVTVPLENAGADARVTAGSVPSKVPTVVPQASLYKATPELAPIPSVSKSVVANPVPVKFIETAPNAFAVGEAVTEIFATAVAAELALMPAP